MVGLENPGIQAIDVWRKLSDFTPAFVTNPDNGNVWVSMHNITGRGTWISVGHMNVSGVETQIRYNIDGGGMVTDVLRDNATDPGFMGISLFLGFVTSLIVEMRLSGVGNAFFSSVAVVE